MNKTIIEVPVTLRFIYKSIDGRTPSTHNINVAIMDNLSKDFEPKPKHFMNLIRIEPVLDKDGMPEEVWWEHAKWNIL